MGLPQFKTCPRCKTELPAERFNKNKARKSGLADRCKACEKAAADIKSEQLRLKHSDGPSVSVKRCPNCETVKVANEFAIAKRRSDGLHAVCKSCASTDSKAWRERNRKRYNKYFADRRDRDDEFRKRGLAYIEDWRRRNIEKHRAYGRAHDAATRGARGFVSDSEWLDMLATFNWHCAYCLKPLRKIHQEHMWPVKRGGPHNIGNVIPSCPRCNFRKGKKTLLEFLQYLSSAAPARQSLMKAG